jgi:hypothetical protein
MRRPPEMDAETLKALKASIAKWERNAAAKKPEDFLVRASDCPLCDLFYERDLCVGCPVAAATGKSACSGTPYHSAHSAWLSWQHGGRSARSHARKEVEFLKSLLPAEEA